MSSVDPNDLRVGDTVVFIADETKGTRKVGTITTSNYVEDASFKIASPKVQIEDRDGNRHVVAVEHVSKPLETTPQAFWARWAYGAASVEEKHHLDNERGEQWSRGEMRRWEDEFRWLFDGYRYSPGGRIQLGLGHEYLGLPKAPLTLPNCFRGDTIVQTKDGPRPIRDLTGEVEVLSQDGVYRTADFRSYGKQRLYRVVLANGDTIHATEDHQWIVSGATERITTKDLAGHRIPVVPTERRPEKNDDYFAGVRHGIIFGDGSTPAKGATSHVELFGDKRWLKSFFHDYKIIEHENYTRISLLPKSYKSLPSGDASDSYWYGFLCGLVATDGNCDDYGCVTINQSDELALGTIRANLYRTGFVAASLKMTRELSPYNGEPAPSFTLRLFKSTITADDLLRPFHRGKFEKANPSRLAGSIEVMSVDPTDLVEEVYCCVEPETHTIVIGAGYLTGQCFVGPKIAGSDDPIEQWRHVLANLRDQIEIQRRGGGYGVNISDIRTVRGAPFAGHRRGDISFVLTYEHKDYAELADLRDSGKFDGVDYVGHGRDWAMSGREHVIDVPDSIDDIMASLDEMVEKAYGGYDIIVRFGALRPRHAPVSSIGRSSGAASWMTLFALVASLLRQDEIDAVDFAELPSFTTNLVEQGGSRRGALMLVYNVNGSCIEKFITRKRTVGNLVGANISVAIDDAFMERVKAYDVAHELGEAMNLDLLDCVRAKRIWTLICESAHASAEPGVIWMERYNRESNSWYYAEIEATNPCGEQGLPPYGNCNLGHHVLPTFVKGEWTKPYEADGVRYALGGTMGYVDWNELERAVRLGVRFQDDIIDYSNYPLPAIEAQAKLERRVGMGTMGLGTMLIMLGLRYGSDDAIGFIDDLYEKITYWAYDESMNLAAEKGAFPAFEYDKFVRSGFMKRLLDMYPELDEKLRTHGIRNVTLLTQAPTGSTGTMIDNIDDLNASTGIEPYYAFTYFRSSRLGEAFEQDVSLVQEYREANGLSKDDPLPDYFVTSMDLDPSEHVRVQAAVQRWCDSSISKTANAPSTYTVEDTARLYMEAYDLGCKGVTIYVDGSRQAQVLATTKEGSRLETHIEDEPLIDAAMLLTNRAMKNTLITEVAPNHYEYSVVTDGEVESVMKRIADDFVEPLTTEEREAYKTKVNEHYAKAFPKRPNRTFGFTEKIKVHVGEKASKVYVTINVDEDGVPFEIFVNANDREIADTASALGRMVTQMLRYGGTDDNVEQVVKHLRRGQTNMFSLPSHLARLIEEAAYKGVEFPNERVIHDAPAIGSISKDDIKRAVEAVRSRKLFDCPECGEKAYDKTACTCSKCGFSSCG